MATLPAPTFGLTAVNCPAPQVNAAVISLTSAFNPSGPGTPGSPFLSSGISAAEAGLCANFNQLSAYAYLIATYGGGSFGILRGLTMTSATGLLLTVDAGQALVGGIAELTNGGTITVPDNTPHVWIWIKAGVQASTGSNLLAAVATSLTPPAGQWTLIGNVTTLGGTITAVDTSGVVYLSGGQPSRTTADMAAPTDTPNAASRIQTYTQGGLFTWAGSTYHQSVDASALSFTGNGAVFSKQQQSSFNVQNLTGTLALTAASPNIQHLTSTGAQTVTLPAKAASNYGMSFTIFNDNPTVGGANIVLKDSTGATTIATINPGYVVNINPIAVSGSAHWPTSGVAPIVQPS